MILIECCPLTIALLSKHGSGFGTEYTTTKTYQPLNETGLDSPVSIGGIQLQFYTGSAAGKLRWDVEDIVAVAVDGQHRLAAIKQFAIANPDAILESQIPVIFLIPSKKAGFKTPQQSGIGASAVITGLRNIFIDLNKNARPVSRTRNILLDDLDIVNVCVRHLIGSKLSANVEGERIPLPLVDWMTEKNKIEAGPFITTVLLLDDYLRTALVPKDVPAMTQLLEPEDRAGIKDWLESKFWPSEQQVDELMQQVDKCIASNVPLTWLPPHIEILATLFDANWRHCFYEIFRRVHPFEALWNFQKEERLLTPEFVNLYCAHEIWEGAERLRRRERIIEIAKTNDPTWRLETRYTEPLALINQEFKDEKWPFKVVFQKALIRSYLELLEQAVEFIDGEHPPLELRKRFTDYWIEAINVLLDSDLGRTKARTGNALFWEGSGLQPDGTIEYTKAGTDRLQGWLKVWVILYKLKAESPTFVQIPNDDADLSAILDNAFRENKPMFQGMKKVATSRLSAGADDDAIKEEAQNLLKSRYNHLRKRKYHCIGLIFDPWWEPRVRSLCCS